MTVSTFVCKVPLWEELLGNALMGGMICAGVWVLIASVNGCNLIHPSPGPVTPCPGMVCEDVTIADSAHVYLCASTAAALQKAKYNTAWHDPGQAQGLTLKHSK